jgi:hypothetical protein
MHSSASTRPQCKVRVHRPSVRSRPFAHVHHHVPAGFGSRSLWNPYLQVPVCVLAPSVDCADLGDRLPPFREEEFLINLRTCGDSTGLSLTHGVPRSLTAEKLANFPLNAPGIQLAATKKAKVLSLYQVPRRRASL